MRQRWNRGRVATLAIIGWVLCFVGFAAPALGAISPTRDANAMAAAIGDSAAGSITGASFPTIPPFPGSTAECSDGQDNDGDGATDHPTDTGCISGSDNREENDAPPQCSDGADNDDDESIDHPDDPGCSSSQDNEEEDDVPNQPPQCSDAQDNDGDDKVDLSDPGCESTTDLDEGSEGLPVGQDPGPAAVADSALAGFPVSGATYGILSTGNSQFADDPNDSGALGQDNQGGVAASRGQSVQDLVTLRVDVNVPSGANCVQLDFRFLSEEFPEFVGSQYNDAFVAELDNSNFTIGEDGVPNAPNNFATDQNGKLVSVNTVGFSTANAAGTTYDGATDRLRASTPVTAGAHSIFLSIFDQGDAVYDSAVFLDRLALVAVPPSECVSGARAPAQCSDGRDNDNDGRTDFPGDSGCSSAGDNDETDPPPPPPPPQCSDGLDNDNDGKRDFPEDPGCSSAGDNDETDPPPPPQCSDGRDNDNDGRTDFPFDPGCSSADDNDETDPPPPPPSITVGNESVSEPDAGARDAVFTVLLSAPSDQPVAVDFATADQSAQAGSDYDARSGRVTIPPGSLTATLTVPVRGDQLKEPDETFLIRLSNPEGGVVAGDGVGTIIDEDSCTIVGTTRADVLRGTRGNDVICGFGGDDRITAGDGRDVLIGGDGDDILHAGEGDDTLEGEKGDDFLRAADGEDGLDGGPGDDLLDGGEGNDRIKGGTGRHDIVWYLNADARVRVNLHSHRVEGGHGADRLGSGIEDIAGSKKNDILVGSSADNKISGGHGKDVLRGLGGDDHLSGGDHDDSIDGDSGDDTLVGGPGEDDLDGGPDRDTCYSGGGTRRRCELPRAR